MAHYDAMDWMEFAFFSANVQHVFPNLDLFRQLDLYHKANCFVEKQSTIDFTRGLASGVEPALRDALQSPTLIVTFHYGYYRMLPVSLLQLGYKLCVLVSRDTLDMQRSYYEKSLKAEWLQHLQFLVAEDPKLFFKIRRYMDIGYAVLCYADGGAGVKNHPDPHNLKMQEVQLGTAMLQSRAGFADIAYLLQRDMLLLLAPTALEEPWCLKIAERYCPKTYASRKNFVSQVLQGIYTQLDMKLKARPEAWESWHYLHRCMPPKSSFSTWPVEQRFIPFCYQEKTFILDRAHYNSYPLKVQQFEQIIASPC